MIARQRDSVDSMTKLASSGHLSGVFSNFETKKSGAHWPKFNRTLYFRRYIT